MTGIRGSSAGVASKPPRTVATSPAVIMLNAAVMSAFCRFHEVRSKLCGEHSWTPSYFAGSTGGATLETVKRYIRPQRGENSPRGRR
jgi:REP element-mobilizing transposase RayT